MELIDIYRSIRNPLDEPRLIDTLINKYGEANERRIDLYSLLTKTAKKENVGRLYESDKNKFYAGLFNAWKNNILSLSRSKFEILKASGQLDDDFIRLRSYLSKIPNAKTYEEAYKVLHGNYNNPALTRAFNKYSWDSKGHYSSWEYISSLKITCYRTKNLKIEHGFYLNVDPLDILKVSMLYIKKCEERNIPYEFKFAKSGGRDDTIVIYTSTKYIMDNLAILNEIKKEYPDVYNKFKKPPILTGKVDSRIGYGSETIKTNENDTYTSVRINNISEAIDEELSNWINNNSIRLVTFRNNTIHIPEYLSVVLTEKIINDMKSSYFYTTEVQSNNAKRSNVPFDKQIVNESLGYSDNDLSDPKFKNYLYQIILKKLSRNFTNILTKNTNESEIDIPLRHNKTYNIYTSRIKTAIKSIVPMINKKDPKFRTDVKKAIERKNVEVGIDQKNIAFDKNIVETFKKANTPEIHKPIVEIPTMPKEKKPQKEAKIIPLESQRVIKVKESPLLHTTYVPSQKLLGDLDELLDYEPDKVIPFLYEHMDAIRLLFPVLIRRNKELADRFIDSNIREHPELQDIYNYSMKRLRGAL